MTIQIIKFRCDTCEREYATEDAAARHENNCYYAPHMLACVTCAHFKAFCGDDQHWTEFGEDVCIPGGTKAECDIDLDLEDTGMCNGSVDHILRSHCEGWEERTAKGTYKYGRVWIEEGDA